MNDGDRGATLRRGLVCWWWLIFLLPSTVNAAATHLRRTATRDLQKYNTSRIIGGSNADPSRYPYFALLDIVTSSGAIYQCGGSLVTADMILTARHCTYDIGFVTRIVAYVNMTGETTGSYERDVTSAIRHLSYNPKTEQNDIMLLKLNNPVLGVPLVQLNTDRDAPSDGEALSVFGFGVTTYSDSATTPSRLQVVTVNTIAHDDCNDDNSYQGQVYDNEMICASAPGKDSCFGDSGGPIVISGGNPAEDVVVGITSWGYGCALSNFPGVYTRVSSYADWIQTRLCTYSDYPPTSCPGVEPPPTSSPTTLPPTEPPTLATTILEEPSLVPSVMPSTSPSIAPSQVPSLTPSTSPSIVPSALPSLGPSVTPSLVPTVIPSVQPSLSPTTTQSGIPSATLSTFPSQVLSKSPSQVPSNADSAVPSSLPSDVPSTTPSTSNIPSLIPSDFPSIDTAPAPTFLLECFSGDATIHVRDNGMTNMKNLQIGDYVLVDTTSRYEQVYNFGHLNAYDYGDYIQLHPMGLQVSANHLVFRKNGRKATAEAVPASMIQVGDLLLGGVVVTNISYVTARGMYAPLTASGRIAVNGIVCSTYISFQDNASTLHIGNNGFDTGLSFHWLSHVFEVPHRLWCQYGRRSSTKETYNENGIATSVVAQMDFVLWLFNEPRIGLMIPLIFLAFTLDLLERILMAPCSVATVVVLVWIIVSKRRTAYCRR
jgi:trypsin